MDLRPILRMQDLPETARPYERISDRGAKEASDSDLLAVLLQSGTAGRSALDIAHELLSDQHFGSLRALADSDPKRLERVNGIGPVKALRLASAFEIGRRLARVTDDRMPACDSPSRCAEIIRPEIAFKEKEVFAILLLNRRNRLIRWRILSEGGIDKTFIEPREVFKEALNVNAYAIVLAHNHPSGDPSPSQSDLASTTSFIEAGRMIGIPIHDHIIVAKHRWQSLRQSTTLFTEQNTN